MTHKHEFKWLKHSRKFGDVWKCTDDECKQVRMPCCACDKMVTAVNIVGHCIPCVNSKGFDELDPDEDDMDYVVLDGPPSPEPEQIRAGVPE